MPSQSKAQHRLMAAACTGKSDSVPKDVACEFMHADKGKDLPERRRESLSQFGKKKHEGKLSGYRR